jgi:DNA-binding transcriptional regulator YdaS (Cro superfamily)
LLDGLTDGKQIAMRDQAILRISAVLGLRAKIARELGMTRAAITKWRQIPAERLPDVERITGIPRHELRPDICPPPAGAE